MAKPPIDAHFRTWKAQNAIFDFNPFLESTEGNRDLVVETKRKPFGPKTVTGITGIDSEMEGVHFFQQYKEVEAAQYVKIFKGLLSIELGLSKTALAVLGLVIDHYEESPMHKGYAQTVTLYNIGGRLNGAPMPFSQNTFTNGLKELINKRVVWPKTDSIFWVNPKYLFKGDRIRLLTEYRLIRRSLGLGVTAKILPEPDEEGTDKENRQT